MARKIGGEDGKSTMSQVTTLQNPSKMILSAAMQQDNNISGGIKITPAGGDMDCRITQLMFHHPRSFT
jgi:hypothetical protein